MPVVAPEGVNSLITATEAANMCGVSVAAITNWAKRGKLTPRGINEHGRKVYLMLDVALAERATRDAARR